MRAPVGSIRAALRVAFGVLLVTTAACGAGVAADDSPEASGADTEVESGGGPDSEDGFVEDRTGVDVAPADGETDGLADGTEDDGLGEDRYERDGPDDGEPGDEADGIAPVDAGDADDADAADVHDADDDAIDVDADAPFEHWDGSWEDADAGDAVDGDGGVEPPPAVARLGYRVVDAEYSRVLDVLVLVAAEPSGELHLYDPATGADVAVGLASRPTAVAVAPDGIHAAVGHDGWVSYVDLSTAAVIGVVPVSARVFDLVLAENGFAYAFPDGGGWERIRCVDLATGIETPHVGLSVCGGTPAKLAVGRDAIYGVSTCLWPPDLEKYDVSAGTAAYVGDSGYVGEYPMCGDLWTSADGASIFTECGHVFRASSSAPEDMTHRGRLEGVSLVEHLDHEASTGEIALIPGASGPGGGTEDGWVAVYDAALLVRDRTFALPAFEVAGRSYASHGRFVFFDRAGTGLVVVVQADASAGVVPDHGVVAYRPLGE